MGSQILSFIGYAEYLQTDRWKQIRAEAIARAGGRCQVCNTSMGLEAHHRTYEKLGTPDELEDVTILCQSCHELFSERLPATPAPGVSSRALSYQGAPR